jgi:hypothetical protein
MGFRSVFVTASNGQVWPQWFRNKYDKWLNIPEMGLLSTKEEVKVYEDHIFLDIQLALDPEQFPLRVVVLHECGGITLVDIHSDNIVYSEPGHGAFKVRPFITHSYCYCCTEPAKA